MKSIGDEMQHAVLLGDSIFDNGSYVPGGPAVIDQLAAALPPQWKTTLLAVDGDVIRSVHQQLDGLPGDATHLIVSCGGNDALGYVAQVAHPVDTVAQALDLFAAVREEFRENYRSMLDSLAGTGRQVAACTIYDCVPDLDPHLHAALSMLNEVILREVFAAGVDLIDLRLVCSHSDDYSALSPIEPSVQGGEKIAQAIAALLTDTPRPISPLRVYA